MTFFVESLPPASNLHRTVSIESTSKTGPKLRGTKLIMQHTAWGMHDLPYFLANENLWLFCRRLTVCLSFTFLSCSSDLVNAFYHSMTVIQNMTNDKI